MNLSQLAVRRPIAVSVGVIVVLVLALLSLNRLGLDLFPDLQLPYVTVVTVYPAADPRTVEEEVTRPVEDLVATIGGLRRVQSTSTENLSVVTAEFGWGAPLERTVEEVRAHVSALSLVLPQEAHPPFVTPIDPAQLPVLIVGLTTDAGPEYTTTRAVDTVRPAFEQVPGVAQVTVLGGVEREIQVLYRSDKLEEHDLTPAMLEQLLSLQNALVPAGVIENDGARLHTRVGNHFSDVQEIRDLVLGESRLPVQGLAALWPPLLHVKDVADVVDGLKAAAGSARIDGEPTVLLQVLKRPGANTVQVIEGLKRVVDQLETTAPDVQVSIITDQSLQITSSLRNLALFGSFGALLAVGVLFLFLRSWRSILVIATAIPLSVVFTIALLFFTDVSLNLMTLGGLSLGIGMLVDNAIIVLESIYRHRSEGAEPAEAAVAGSREVAGAVVAATLTTVVVFLPVLFMETFAARLFRELGLTVSLSLLASLLVSLTVVPALASRLLRRDPAAAPARPSGPAAWREAAPTREVSPGPAGRLGDAYERALAWALDRKGAVLVAAVVVIGLTATLWPRLGLQFLPDSPTRALHIAMETPPGTPLSRSEAVADEAVARLEALDLFDFVTVQVGEQHQDDLLSILGDHGPTSVKLIAVGKKPFFGQSMHDALREARAALADMPVERLSVSHQWESDANVFSGDVVLRVQGHDDEQLEAVALALRGELADHPAIAEVHVSLAERQPELFLAVDQSRALIGGLTTGQISLAVRHALTGVQATQVRQDGRTIPVVLRPHPDELRTLDDLLNFRVSSPVVTSMDEGGGVRLGNVVEARKTTGPQAIRHVDGARVVEVRVRPAAPDVRPVHAAVAAALEAVDPPPGVHVREGGVTELIDESLTELGFALLFSLLLVYLVMVAQFESWRNPLIILTTTPLAAVGVLWALRLTDTSVSVMPLLGLVILGGIVVNNGILLVDYISGLDRAGLDVRRAVLTGARTRLRPVLMTATTTVGGMLPLAVSQGEGMEMQGPLAVTVIGGLLAATVLTLFVVPTLYALIRGDRRPGPSGPVSAVALGGLLLSAAVAWAAAPAAAQTPAASKPTFAVGLGYDAGVEDVVYMAGAGWGAYVGDVDWTLYGGAAGIRSGPPTWLLGARGAWFQPVSFAGYYELEGELLLRQAAGSDDPALAVSLAGDAVLGNVTLHVQYDHVGDGFPSFPWDDPSRLTVPPDPFGMTRLRGEGRQQVQRELNVVREFQWLRRGDEAEGPGRLLALTGAEIRASRAWLAGKVGVRVEESRWRPVIEAGLRMRPDVYSDLEIKLVSADAAAPFPSLTAVYDVQGPLRAYSTRLTLQMDGDDKLIPAVVFQSEPLRDGVRWQLALDGRQDRRFGSFGLFTTF